MKRFLIAGLLISLCTLPACGRQGGPSVNVAPIQNDQNATIAPSDLQSALIRHGFEFVKLRRDNKTAKLYANCFVNGTVISLNIDTGVFRTVIAADVAAELKLTVTEAATKPSTVGTDSKRLPHAQIDNFRLGDLKAAPYDVWVIDLATTRTDARHRGHIVLDGILGADFLFEHSCVIDFANDILYYSDPTKKNRVAPATLGSLADKGWEAKNSLVGSPLLSIGYESVTLTRNENTLLLSMNCMVNGKTIRMAVDTGANPTSVSIETAKELKLAPKDMPWTVALPGLGLRRAQVAMVQDLRVGDLRSNPLEAMIMDFSVFQPWMPQIDGLLGTDWIGQYACVIDVGNGVLYLLNPLKKSPALSKEHSGETR